MLTQGGRETSSELFEGLVVVGVLLTLIILPALAVIFVIIFLVIHGIRFAGGTLESLRLLFGLV